MGAIISRFAPAPTGFLHLGHVVNAVYVWSETRARRGRVLLRIEDHDRQRSRREYEAEILDDLAWLGFEADGPPVRQSERGDIYESALNALRRQGLVYACACSRADIAERDAGRPVREPNVLQEADSELCYPGTCRDRGLAEGPGVGLRVRLQPTVERFVDLRHGPQEQRPSEQCGDLLAKDREGNWTYQFAAAVDDYMQGVTLVVRGDDLLASTGRQIQLARLFGRADPPQFLHHPLILKSSGGHVVKLSKSDGDSGIRELRAKGWTAKNVIDHAMSLLRRFPYDHA
jgi:glutamyl/glutaminyl-tRNA synthetase